MKKSILIASLVLSSGAFAQQVKTTPVTQTRPQPAKAENIQFGTEKGHSEKVRVDVKSLNERMKEAETQREIQSETARPKSN